MKTTELIRTLLLSGVFFVAVDYAKAQENTEVDSSDFVEWQKGERLSWDDYRFRTFKRRRAGEMAITSVKISARGYIRKGIPDFNVKVFFVKPDSWTTDTTDVRLLAHEQIHFDIGEIYAYRIRKKIDEMREAGITSPRRYQAAIRNLITIFKSYSGQYDRETSFGTLPEEQNRWRERISSRIDEILSN